MNHCNKNGRAEKAIKNAFVELMIEKGYEKITVLDIVEKSGYSRNSFYKYYTDKIDIGKKTIEDEANRFVQIVNNSISRCEIIEIGKGIYEPAYDLLEHVMNNRNLYKLIFESKVPGYSLDDFVELVASRGKAETDIVDNRADSLDRDFSFYANTYWLIAQIMFWEKKNFPFSIKYMAQQITYLLSPTTCKTVSLKKRGLD